MKKRVWIVVLLLAFLLPMLSYADESKEKGETKVENFEITTLKEDAALVDTPSVVIGGVGQEKDKIEITAYSIKRKAGKDKGKQNEIETLLKAYGLEIDALRVFAQEVKLKGGENRIQIVLTRGDNKYTFYKTVNYNRDMKEEFNKIIRQMDLKDTVKLR